MNNVELYFIFACLLISVFLICDFLHRKKLYEAGSYYNITKTPFILIGRNIGSYGEYLIYETLKHLESERAKFLFNLYIPTYNGKTTEIDAVMISQCGIFVFESKTDSLAMAVTECVSFFGCRLATGLLDVLIMFVSVNILHCNDMVMKILSNILVIILNYIFSKLFIFGKNKS